MKTLLLAAMLCCALCGISYGQENRNKGCVPDSPKPYLDEPYQPDWKLPQRGGWPRPDNPIRPFPDQIRCPFPKGPLLLRPSQPELIPDKLETRFAHEDVIYPDVPRQRPKAYYDRYFIISEQIFCCR